LTIQDRGLVDSNWYGWVGYQAGSLGTATIRGAGSRWDNRYHIRVGYWGNGTMEIQAGGVVSNALGYIGWEGGDSTGAVRVVGAGSRWENTEFLRVGNGGKLEVSDWGQVTAKGLIVGLSAGSPAAIALHVTGDDMIVLGDALNVGGVTNWGTISLYADPSLAAGVYSPISEFDGRTMGWAGSGSYEAFGGVWNGANRTFEVSATTLLDIGDVDSVSSGERLLFTDPGSGESVGVSFSTVPGSTTFSAGLLDPADLASLAAMLGPTESVLAGYEFTTTLSGEEALLTFDIGSE